MRHLLAGACSLLFLTACGGTGTPTSSGPDPAPARTDVPAGVETAHCASPEGYRVEHPVDWHVNPGDVLPGCSWFAAEPFAVPEASDVRVADIALSVQPVSDLSARLPDETARSTVEVGGRPALRLELVTGPGFYPEGTPITTYVVDLGPARKGEEVLVADAVGLPGVDHERNVEVLDAMMASLALDGAGRV
ncbi:hypothetical protein [Blastococcus brunescens]|uniref:DUF3558 domain-containing protein n=1 Tax=Blastococcus brunescens TaxID=1564165 RepID=A0ABZ1B568_9ACTN|nr:hypothetical protein [Blastococcus sp. BMG 8361]WRL65879.1 hypothetical protein U6N30_10160 [Blastococcus sp. BMG 8361]